MNTGDGEGITVSALKRGLMRLAALVLVLWTLPFGAQAEAPVLSLPVACELGRTCFIQNYVDVDPSAGAKDHRCGGAAYDGHKGTDFRVLSTRATRARVPVLAAADGEVKAVRDGMADRLVGADTSPVAGRECGNGVVLTHGEGWETQYCHLLRGSVRVRKGQSVRRGDPLGLVGYSGQAAFAHLHFGIRHAGTTIDPFTGRPPASGSCGRDETDGLWRPELRSALAYRSGGVLEVGFSNRPVTTRELETGAHESFRPAADAAALLFYARTMNANKGDRFRLRLSGPNGVIASTVTAPLPRHKAMSLSYVGRKRRGERWPAGVYEGRVEVLRAGGIVDRRSSRFRLP